MINNHRIKRVYHYSTENGHWKWDIVRKQVLR